MKQITNEDQHKDTCDLFLEVRFEGTYSTLRSPLRMGLFQPFAALKQSLKLVECSSQLKGHKVSARTSTQNWSLLLALYK